MKILKKQNTTIIPIESTCVASEYEMNDRDINGAVISIKGRSPEKGNVLNTLCKELVYVIDGTGKLVVNEKVYVLYPGDMVIIDQNEKYYWDGNMELFAACTPAWNAKQSKSLD